MYESDHTRWMREMMAKNPEWAADQKKGRAIWWDKPSTLDEQARLAQAKVSNKGYPYDVNFDL
jgi:hypothetical protein